MEWPAITLLITQCILLIVFCFFAFFNYLYGFASLWTPKIQRVKPSNKQVAVVVVSFNEKNVIEETIKACDQLTYKNKLIVLADDSSDIETIEKNRGIAKAHGCKRVEQHSFVQEIIKPDGTHYCEPIEIWESPGFVFFHRPVNAGFKAGSLKKVHGYLKERGIDLMYLLDADWHPQKDAIERTMEVLEADKKAAFVQTKRVSSREGMNLFQKYVALHEEGCYYSDFEGRQVLNHPTLFSGCCTLLKLDVIEQIGGFTPGHLTEDLDLTDRFWLNGWKGIYLSSVVNHGEVPFTYEHFRRQQERWAAGSARALREFFWPILKTNQLGGIAKLSAIRQNAYFTSTLFTGIALIVGIITITWLAANWNTYSAEYYLYLFSIIKGPFLVLVYACILANFIEPLVMILIKKRSYEELFHLPMSFWYAWGNLHTYIAGNIKGLFNLKLGWFCTPKFNRDNVGHLPRIPTSMRLLNIFTFVAFLGLYFSEGWVFGWRDEFALLWLPAFLIASVK
ncbi:MAG: glycosyltransferase family 2 protein [Gammaproteobacteria bacterium]|nr:glycosyltransferase family 2 protein [Gammaproteobacteria bacterium]MCF6259217.1 glycosyltransferase family 2 protein [Gammaproteobacteria bacterium]